MARKDRFALDTLDTTETAALEADAGAPLPQEADQGAQVSKPRERNLGLADEPAPAAAEGEAEPAVVEGAPAVVDPNKPASMVPHAALHEERERRKEAQQAIAQRDAQIATLTERTNRILETMATRQPLTPEAQAQQAQNSIKAVPDFAADPAGHIAALLHNQEVNIRATQAQVQDLSQGRQQQNVAVQQAQAVQQVQARAAAMEADFRTAQPDYEAALNHLVTQRHEELKQMGVSDASQRAQILQQEALGIAARSAQEGTNPAQIIYNLAGVRGYKKVDPAAAAAAGAQGNGAARVAAVAQGQAAQGPGLGAVVGGRAPKLTAQSLLNMSAAEFDRMLATPEGRELMGN